MKVCWDRKWSDKIRWDCVAIRGEKEKIEKKKEDYFVTNNFLFLKKDNFLILLVSSSQFVLVKVFRHCLYAIYSLKKKHSRWKKNFAIHVKLIYIHSIHPCKVFLITRIDITRLCICVADFKT